MKHARAGSPLRSPLHSVSEAGAQQGFSLTELTVVVVILGVLAAVAVPNLAKTQSRVRRRDARATLETIYTAEGDYYARRQRYTTSPQDLELSDMNVNDITYTIAGGGGGFTATATYRACTMRTDQTRTTQGGLTNESAWTDPC